MVSHSTNSWRENGQAVAEIQLIAYLTGMNSNGMQGMYYGASPKLMAYAHQMRNHATVEEGVIWQKWSEDPLQGFNLRRQHPIATFIADFYCHKVRLVIEIDGGNHLQKSVKDYDDFRDEDMRRLGIHVLRFTNGEVFNEPDIVLEKIKQTMKTLKNSVNGNNET